MAHPLHGKTVALAEGRQLEEMAAMFQDEGAAVFRCPLLSILDAPDASAVESWLAELIAGRFGLLVVMTGEALRRLTGFAERAGQKEEYLAALERTPMLARGPKPVRTLRELGVSATPRAASGPTTDGVIATLRGESLNGVVVGLTLFGQDNPVLERFLQDSGAVVRPVLSYVFAPAAEDDRVAELIGRLAAGSVDAMVFTSSPQVDRLWEVAQRRGIVDALTQGLERVKVAAVGPLVADALKARGATVDICPEQGWVMKNLVKRVARAIGA